jgi:hypothetical protein
MAIFAADLRHRSVDFKVPSYPLADSVWFLLLQHIYAKLGRFLRETIKTRRWLNIPALLGRQGLDDVQTGHSRDHLSETEPSFTQEVAIFLHRAFLPSGHEHHDYIRELSGRGSIAFE